ncbi:MAG: hypothetical protein MUC48_24540 [Leptolyngbya sp. Prado105]|jgi:hypothetical protein|nr:hypothetical protein [Leptolyngbya sp. Prado105]
MITRPTFDDIAVNSQQIAIELIRIVSDASPLVQGIIFILACTLLVDRLYRLGEVIKRK